MSPIDKQSFASPEKATAAEKAESASSASSGAAKQRLFSTTGLIFVFAIIIGEGIALYMLFKYFVQNNPVSEPVMTNPEQPDFVNLSEIQAVLQIGPEGRTTGAFRLVPVLELDGDMEIKKETRNLIKIWEPKIIDGIRTEMSRINYMRARLPEEADVLKKKVKEIVEVIINGKGRVKDVTFPTYLPP